MATDFRIYPESAGFDYPFSLIQRIWDELATPHQADARLADLTPGQRAAYSLHWIFAEVCNGGFDQCFSNSTGYLLPEAIGGAQVLGAPNWEAALTDAAATMGDPFPRDRHERQRRLKSIKGRRMRRTTLDRCDERLYALDADPDQSLDTIIDRYARAHPADFYLDAPDEATAVQALLDTTRQAIDAPFQRDLDLAERLVTEARDRAERAERASIETTASLARSLLDQLSSLRG